MAYKYTTSSLPITGKSPKEQYTNQFQQTLNEQFYNAQNWYTIQEEYPIESKIFKNVDVRVAHVINAETGLKLGDDWKTLLFKEIDHEIKIGKLYSFDNNTWITVNTEVIKNLTATSTIRRCNNTLRWLDEKTGAYYEEPCSIEYLVKEPRDYATAGSPFITPGGFLHIIIQFNERTNKIKQNQRFLFGNKDHWVAYKVVGTGINAFNNLETYNNMSSGIMNLDMVANYTNEELDDLINGIADVNTNIYTLNINPSSITANVGDTYDLSTVITYNGYTETRPIVWTSSNSEVVSVSDMGKVTMKKLGTAIITANIEDNPVNNTCTITVVSSPVVNSEIIISPDTNYVYEYNEKIYTVNLYKNGVVQSDSFIITCNPNSVPSDNYTFEQLSGNSFKIKNNKKTIDSYLTITCQTGVISKLFNINLRGGW